MKFTPRSAVIMVLSFVICASAKTLTTDPITGLPLDPATDSRLHLGNEPTKLSDMKICKSNAQSEFYIFPDSKMDATVAWYVAHLSGFHKTHVYLDNRSQDTFYNDAGTMIVAVLGDRGKEGANGEAYSVTYLRLQPGLSAKTIIAYSQHTFACQ